MFTSNFALRTTTSFALSTNEIPAFSVKVAFFLTTNGAFTANKVLAANCVAFLHSALLALVHEEIVLAVCNRWCPAFAFLLFLLLLFLFLFLLLLFLLFLLVLLLLDFDVSCAHIDGK